MREGTDHLQNNRDSVGAFMIKHEEERHLTGKIIMPQGSQTSISCLHRQNMLI